MHLFLVVGGGRVPAVSHLDGALSRAAAPIPALGDADRWSFRSARAGLVAPGLHHAGSRCAPRRYRHVASNGWVTAYDGFPLLEGGGEPWDAATLAAHWERLPEVLEGAGPPPLRWRSNALFGGQLGSASTGKLLDGIEAQTTQAMRNVLTVLAAAGTGPEHAVKLNIYLATGVDAQVGYAASRSVWGDHRTAIMVVSTAGHARPGALVEIDAVATIPE